MPGSSSRYGTSPRGTREIKVARGWAGRGEWRWSGRGSEPHDSREVLGPTRLLVLGGASELEQPRGHLVGREDQRVFGELGVHLDHGLACALHRTDVVDPGLDRRRVDG